MKSEVPQLYRQPFVVAGAVGSFSMALGLVVHVTGVLAGAEEALLKSYQEAGFALESGSDPWWSLPFFVLLVYTIALLLLEVPGGGRRLLLSCSLLVLLCLASPVLALWGVFWSPLLAVVSSGWSGFCAILWARHYPMPCESMDDVSDGKVISMVDTEERPRKQG